MSARRYLHIVTAPGLRNRSGELLLTPFCGGDVLADGTHRKVRQCLGQAADVRVFAVDPRERVTRRIALPKLFERAHLRQELTEVPL